LQPEKLQHVRLFEQVLRLGDVLALLGEFSNCLLITTEREALIETRVELALEFA
jgi:hypothetical protein